MAPATTKDTHAARAQLVEALAETVWEQMCAHHRIDPSIAAAISRWLRGPAAEPSKENELPEKQGDSP